MSTYDATNERRLKELASAMQALELLKKREAFDPVHLDSRPTAMQQAVIDDFGKVKQQWIRAGNQSGKSQTCARIFVWLLTGTHPSWSRPDSWGEEPLLVIVCGRTGKQIEDSLLPKIRGYLEPGTYKEVRIGNIIQRVELSNGNRIIFQSLENPTVARERLQSYVAHAVWVDELPPTMDIVRELLIRVQARDGYFLASFTPTVVSPDIQKYVDGLKEPEAKVYRFHMLDNPLYSNPKRKEELMSRYSHLPPSQQEMVFKGEWLSPEGLVYFFDYETMVEMPQNYSPLWRHVASVDPATQSKLGLTLWAENPSTKIWYLIRADYIEKIYVPTQIIAAVEFILKDYNVVKRIADPEATWFINQARVSPFNKFYDIVPDKAGRKHDLIKGLQQFLAGRARVSPTCIDFISEIQQCRWSDTAPGRIVNASHWHLLDSAQYFCDQAPPPEKDTVVASSWQQALYQANENRQKKVEELKQKVAQKMRLSNNRGKRRAWRLV